LESFGVDFSQKETIFKQSKKILKNFFIAAPLPHLCTKYVMVTDRELPNLKKSVDAKLIQNISTDLASILFKKSILISNFQKSNLNTDGDRFSLHKFAPINTFDFPLYHQHFQLIDAIKRHRQDKVTKIGTQMGFSPKEIKAFLRSYPHDYSIRRALCLKNPVPALGLAEAYTSLIALTHQNNIHKLKLAPLAVGFFAKYWSPTFTNETFPFSLLNSLKHLR
jgi:hypothetical protein